MIKRGGNSAFLAQFVFMLFLLLPAVSFCGDIMVQPGKFDHFDIRIPQKIVAGDKIPLEIMAVDSFNNIISNFDNTGRDFSVSVSGSASATPAALSSSAFTKGVAKVTLRDTVAETFTMTIFEKGNTLPLQSKDIRIYPGKLASLMVRGPRAVQAGDRFDVKMFAVDSFGNPVAEHMYGKNINVLFRGGAEPRIIGQSVPDFTYGVGTVTLMSEKSGSFSVEVRDLVTGSTGTSEWIEVLNNALASFRLTTPKEIIAGESFEVSITPVDNFGNVVKNYSSVESGVVLISSGKARPFPSSVSASEFINGLAKVYLRYDTIEPAHDIVLTAAEINRKNQGTSKHIRVLPQIPSKYEVTNPEAAVAGQKFRIKITVYNQVGNPIKNYNQIGQDIILSATGRGKLTPSRIPASEFANGSALVDVQYNKSEAFSIVAEPMPSVKKPATGRHSRKVEKKTEKKAERKANAEASSDKTEIMRTPFAGGQTTGKTFDITAISIVESKKRTVVSIHIPALMRSSALKYTAHEVTVDGKKWIAVAVRPASNKITAPVAFDSAAVGKVVTEESADGAGTVFLKIENLRASKFQLRRGDKSLAVTLTR
ncbi:MAG TPA: hypothetical protein VK448_01355 [Dissulfurispiraceae bacterium]|nr:hypothetical protein [Dissulfurispiraceae bacterium]